jgi:predicted secreted protein
MPTSLSGFGVILSRGAVALAKITKISGIDISHDVLDTTSHDSPGGYKENIQGLLDAGDVSVEADYIPTDPAQISLLNDAQVAPGVAPQAWTMNHPTSGLTWTFNAVVKNLKINTELTGKITLSFTLSITGTSTLYTTSSARLTALTVTGATLVKAYTNADTIDYATTSGTSFTVTPTLAGATITVNGTVVSSGSASGSISISGVGTVIEVPIITQQTNSAPTLLLLRVIKTA